MSAPVKTSKRKSAASAPPTATKKVVLPVKKVSAVEYPKIEVDGKLIKINVRTHGKWTFYDGTLVVSESEYLKITKFGDDLQLTGDFNPYWVQYKFYKGEDILSYFVKFNINGQNIKDANELQFLTDLAASMADIHTTLGAKGSSFEKTETDPENGEEEIVVTKKKYELILIYNTTTQTV